MTDPAAAAPTPTAPSAPTERRIELDVLRGIALIGVCVLNYHGYLIQRGGDYPPTSLLERILDPWEGPLSTRFAAVFVTVAGMGITLLTTKAVASRDRQRISAARWTLIRRGVLLYAFGYFLDWIWNGTILFFYGAFFLAGAALFTLRTRWIATVGTAAALAAAGVQWWALQRRTTGHNADWLLRKPLTDTHSPREQLFATFLRGTHPLLPWLAFLCLGIILGRLLPFNPILRVQLAMAGVTATLFGYLAEAGLPVHPLLRSTDPFDRGLLYVVTAIGTTLIAVSVLGWLAERTRASAATQALADTGRTTLTLYVGHVLLFDLVVDWLGWVTPGDVSTALLLALGYWVIAVAVSVEIHRRHRQGPLEWAYRKFSA